jgi:hypothetical protein
VGPWILILRFYRIVAPVPALVSAMTLTVLAVCAVLAIVAPGATSAPLPALLVLQIFAASSGVVGPARRGYYDALLSRGVGRAQILWGHWLASTGPGVVCWAAVALLDQLTHRGDGHARALAPGTLVALWLASSVPWAATVALPRFAAAIAWLVVLVTTLTTLPSGQATLVAALDDRAASWPATMAALVYPMGLVGRTLSPAQWTAVAPALVLSVAAPAAAFLWFTRADIPLEASQ